MPPPRTVQKITELNPAPVPVDPNALVAAVVVNSQGVALGTYKVRIADLSGPTGSQGPKGDTGNTGPQGVKGDLGNAGPQGSIGPQGIQGIQGVPGDTGSKGDMGEQGAQGLQGASYLPGAVEPFANRSSFNNREEGFGFLASDQGNIYFRIGAAGNWTAAAPFGKGDKGDRGDQGDQGFPGSAGPQGIKGDTGDFGAPGIQGPKGDIGNTGATGPQGTVGATGPQGTVGATGPQGTVGATGPQGTVGATGPAGQGVLPGGLEGHIQIKLSDADFDTGWVPISRLSVTLNTLAIDTLSWSDISAAGAVLGNITGKTAGSTITVVPNDGRVVVNSSGTALLRGLTAWAAGPLNFALKESLPGAPASPKSTNFNGTITDAVPVFTSLNSVSVPENQVLSFPITTDQTDVTLSVVGGADASYFSFVSGSLTMAAKNYEVPSDADANNIYLVQVKALRPSGSFTIQTITVTVQDCFATPRVSGDVAGATKISAASSFDILTRFTSASITIPLAANRTLVCAVAGHSTSVDPGAHLSVYLSSDSAGNTPIAGGAFTQQQTSGLLAESGSNVRHTIWTLESPPVGTYYLNATRTAPSANCRWGFDAVMVAGVLQGQTPTPLSFNSYTNNSGTTAYTTGPLATPADDMLVVGHVTGVWGNGTNNSVVYNSSEVEVKTFHASGAQVAGSMFVREELSAGNHTYSWTCANSGGATSGVDSTNMLALAFRTVPYRAADPIYFVNNATGNDTNSGLSASTAFKSLDPIDALNPVPPSFQLVLEDGQYHRHTYASGAYTLTLSAQGGVTALTKPKILTRSGGKAWISGDVAVNTGWSAANSTETNAAAVAIGVEKRTMGAGFNRMNFPCIDGVMLQPCTWSSAGYPSSIHAWDDQTSGTDAFAFPASVQSPIGPPSAYDGISEVQCKFNSTTKVWTLRITKASANAAISIGGHYGAVTPVGAMCAFRLATNLITQQRITAYSQSGDWIEVQYTDTGGATGPYDATGFCWSIHGCPLDLRRTRQFAWALDDLTLYATFPTGTDRSVSRFTKGLRLIGDYWDVQGVASCRTSMEGSTTVQSANDSQSLWEPSGTGHVYNNQLFKQAMNPDRPRMIGNAVADLTSATITNLEAEELRHHGGIYLLRGYNCIINGAKLREMGRSLIYFAGYTGTAGVGSNGNIASNIDGCEHVTIHGNVGVNYQQAFNNAFQFIGFTGAGQGIVSQVNTAITDKSCDLLNFFGSAVRPTSTTVGVAYDRDTPLCRIDGGETGSHWDKGVLVLVKTSAIHFGDVVRDNANSTWERIVCQSLDFNVSAAGGSNLKDVLALTPVYRGTGRTGSEPWNTSGGAVLDANSKVDTSENFDTGCLSTQMQQFLTRNDARSGYQSVQMGPSSWAWTLEPFGTAPTLVDVKITTDWVRDGHRAGKTIGSIVRTRAGSSLSLPAAANNSLFDIDRGVVFFKANAAVGVYTLRVRETNGASFRDTDIPITVR